MVEETLLKLHLKADRPLSWGPGSLESFVRALRERNKPSLIAANKADLPAAAEKLPALKASGKTVIPCAAEAELLLRKAAEAGVVAYTPGDPAFKVTKEGLTPAQARALELVKEKVLSVYGATGVQQAIDQAYFGLLKAVVVYPVEDETKLCNRDGDVLPDAYVMNGGSTAVDLARRIHSDLAQPRSSTPSTRGRGCGSLRTMS